MQKSAIWPVVLNKIDKWFQVSNALADLIGHMKRGVSDGKSDGSKYGDIINKAGGLAEIEDREALISNVRDISQLAIGPNGLVHRIGKIYIWYLMKNISTTFRSMD